MNADPGLDVFALQGLRAITHDLDLIRRRITSHLDAHEGYVAFSGGKDSLVVLHLTHQIAPDVPVVFFDSGLEFPETYEYLAELARSWALNLRLLAPKASALEVMATNGSWDHHAPSRWAPDLHQTLIGEPASRAHQDHGPGELWGVRAAESRGRAAAYANALRAASCDCRTACAGRQRRMRHGGRIARLDGTVAYGPVWDWTTAEIWGHVSRYRLPVNPVYAKLRRLGAPEDFLRISAMIDGNRLTEGRITWLRRGWPTLFDELAAVLPRIREFV